MSQLKWELFTPVMVALEPLRRAGLRQALAAVHERYPLTGKRILDVGAGTGSLLAEIVRYECDPVAVEPSFTMARIARRRFPRVPVFTETAAAMPSVGDASVDLTIVAATLHGLPPEYRQEVYAELRRVTRDVIAIVDYHRNRNALVALAEWVEGGDYFAFVDVVDAELERAFGSIEKHRLKSFESLYLARLPRPATLDQETGIG